MPTIIILKKAVDYHKAKVHLFVIKEFKQDMLTFIKKLIIILHNKESEEMFPKVPANRSVPAVVSP